jgi:hypothetical protein
MLTYDENLDGFVGDDDDDSDVDDNGDIINIDDLDALIDNAEADEDENDPDQAYYEDFIPGK